MSVLPLSTRAVGALPLRAFIYQRVSHDPRKRGTSVRDQETENRRTCDFHGWTVVESFTDQGRSASRYAKARRPEYERMLERIERRETDIVVAWESSRTNRDVALDRVLVNLCGDIGVLICYNGRVYDPRDPDDRYVLGLNALNAEREADAIRARINRTVRLNTEEGRPRGRIPFGYERTYDPASGKLNEQVVQAEQAELIRRIADRIYGGESLNSIAKDLNAREIATPGGGAKWTPTQVKRLVLKPSNVGLRQHQGRVVGKATWEPILDPKVYEVCEALIEGRAAKLAPSDGKVKYLLSGVAVAECGAPLYARPSGSRLRYICTSDWCCAIRVDTFDSLVQMWLLAYYERPEFLETLAPVADNAGAKSAMEEIADLEARLAEATELAAAGALSMVRLADLEAKLQPQIDAARFHARSHLVQVPPVVHRVAGARAREVWEELDLNQKRDVIRSTVTVTLHRARQGQRTITPDRFSIVPVRGSGTATAAA